MAEDVYNNIYDRIEQLNKRERQLRAEISEVRKQRASLKAQCNVTYISDRPDWLESIPQEAWLPSYYASRVINNLGPNVENRNLPPDLLDWSRAGSLKDFIINTGIAVAVIVLGLQIIFILF